MYDKKQAYYMFIIGGIILVAVIGWFVCAGRGDVSNLRNGSNDIRNELESAQDRQREERQAIDMAADAAERSTEAVGNSQRAAEEIQNIERTDAELIENCQRIIQQVRARGRTESKD